MEVIVYSTTSCNICKMIKSKLMAKGILFEDITDITRTVEFGALHGILSAPIVVVDGEILNAQAAAKRLGLS